MRRAAAVTVLSLASLLGLGAGPGLALSIEPGAVAFHDHLGHRGTLTFHAVGAGLPAGDASVLAGAVSPGDVTVVMQIELAPDSLELPNFFVQALDGAAPGLFLGVAGGGRIDAGGLAIAAMAIAEEAGSGDVLHLLFDGILQPGERSEPFFAAWPELGAGDFVGTLQITTFRPPLVRRDFFGGEVVPEPASAALLALGLAALSRRRPRR